MPHVAAGGVVQLGLPQVELRRRKPVIGADVVICIWVRITSFTSSGSTPTSGSELAGQRRWRRPRAAATSAVKPVSITTVRCGAIATHTK